MDSSKIKILNTALNLFSEKGYNAIGVQAICEISNLTKPTLYYYFGSKSGVLKALFKEYCSKLDAILIKNSKYLPNNQEYKKDIFPVLVNVCDSYFEFAKNNQNFYKLMCSALYSPVESELKTITGEFIGNQFEIIKNMFHEMAQIHTNIKRHEQYLPFILIGTINSCIMFNIRDISPEELVQQFMHGIFS